MLWSFLSNYVWFQQTICTITQCMCSLIVTERAMCFHSNQYVTSQGKISSLRFLCRRLNFYLVLCWKLATWEYRPVLGFCSTNHLLFSTEIADRLCNVLRHWLEREEETCGVLQDPLCRKGDAFLVRRTSLSGQGATHFVVGLELCLVDSGTLTIHKARQKCCAKEKN